MARAFASEIYFGEPLGLTVPDAARMPLCYRRKIPSAAPSDAINRSRVNNSRAAM